MTDNLNGSDDDEQVTMLNGRSVMNALAFLNSEATEYELLQCFSASNRDARDIVQQELKRTLDDAVKNGFISRKDGKYAVPGLGNVYQVDGDIISDDDDDGEFTGFDRTDVAIARGAVVRSHQASGAYAETCSTSTATKRSRDDSDASTTVTVTITTNPSATTPAAKKRKREGDC